MGVCLPANRRRHGVRGHRLLQQAHWSLRGRWAGPPPARVLGQTGPPGVSGWAGATQTKYRLSRIKQRLSLVFGREAPASLHNGMCPRLKSHQLPRACCTGRLILRDAPLDSLPCSAHATAPVYLAPRPQSRSRRPGPLPPPTAGGQTFRAHRLVGSS